MSKTERKLTKLSDGSFGKVYLMQDLVSDRLFIRKIFRKKISPEEIIDELKVLLNVYDRCEQDFICIRHAQTYNKKYPEPKKIKNRYYFDLNYIYRSTDLNKFMGDNYNRLTLNDMLYIIDLVLTSYSRIESIINHNDIKLANILISVSGRKEPNIRFIDYGLSCMIFDASCNESIKGVSFASYFAPELYSKKYDIIPSKLQSWQLGLVIFDIITNMSLPSSKWDDESYLISLTDNMVVDKIEDKLRYVFTTHKLFKSVNKKVLQYTFVNLYSLIVKLVRINPKKRISGLEAKQKFDKYFDKKEFEIDVDQFSEKFYIN